MKWRIRRTWGTPDQDNVYGIQECNIVSCMVEGIVKEWDAQKETFYKQTGISQRNEIVAVDEFEELELLLNEWCVLVPSN